MSNQLILFGGCEGSKGGEAIEVFGREVKFGSDQLCAGQGGPADALVSMGATASEHVDDFVGEHASQSAAHQEVGVREVAARHCGLDGAGELIALDLSERLDLACGGVSEGERAAFVVEVRDRLEDTGSFEPADHKRSEQHTP